MKTKTEPLVNLNVNPCKMCMPMGAVTALYGVKKCISILHGSQGCSTYIRRHMATHYNEPVDIASSSLTEQGTVYGGEENLMKGLQNIIQLYQPEVIGVATTCLSETIGEDIGRMIDKFQEENPQYADITIIPVHSAGYGGSHYDGYVEALYQIVSVIDMETEKHNKINVLTGMLSPADIRFLKRSFQEFGLETIFLPDISENLDGAFTDHYNRLPSKGTAIEEIKRMAGARLTIEMGSTDGKRSAGKYLLERYQVPYRSIGLPVGLRDIDSFYRLLSEISGLPVPRHIKEERGRYLDAMIDAHKYNGDGKAAVFGDPDFVVATVRLCAENGIMPVVVATGTDCPEWKSNLESEVKELAGRYFNDEFYIKEDVDFKEIEQMAERTGANILIGNADGRRMEESLGIPLVRRGFPIHDRVGGQRLRMLGYEGSLLYLDEISNAVLARKETGFRKKLFQTYFNGSVSTKEENPSENAEIRKAVIAGKTETHPCFHCGAHEYARIHLPVAPACNIQCNYCVRKFDCPNESRPGVASKVVTPKEAFEKYKIVKQKVPNLSVVGIAGPGEALANFDEVRETLERIREDDENVTFCLSTNGLMLPEYVEELVRAGVSHVTVTCNAVDPVIAGKIYKYINYMGKRFTDESAGAIMVTNQLTGLRMLTERGVVCKVNIVILKGINDSHIPEIVEKVKETGCYMTNIMPHIPVEGSPFENNPIASNMEINAIRDACGQTMKQMYHCRQCRADAIGTLESDVSIEFSGSTKSRKAPEVDSKYRFAVASKSGMLTDQHFGHAKEIYIYEYKNDHVYYVETREIGKYCNGAEACGEEEVEYTSKEIEYTQEDKISRIIHAVSDCNGIIAMRIGEAPKRKLKEKGIFVYSTYDYVEEAVKKAVLKIG